jgi:hypothetical protein
VPRSFAALQEVLESTQSLVKDWSFVWAICPPSMPGDKMSLWRERSKCFRQILPSHHLNMFWLQMCRTTQQMMPTESCLFQPISHPIPFPEFAKVCVIVSGYGDGVRRGIANTLHKLGGECVAVSAL